MASSSCLHPSLLLFLLVLFALRSASSGPADDGTECADQLMGMATCLPYVQGSARAPTPDCCAGFEQAIAVSPRCLCVLIKDQGEPEGGIRINVTLAMLLPSVCHAPANVSDCPRLLKLPPDSKEADFFKQFGGAAQGKVNITGSGSGSKDIQASGGGRPNYLGVKEGWLGVEMVGDFWMYFAFLLSLPFFT